MNSLFISTFLFFTILQACTYEDGQISPQGNCLGPMDRSRALRNNLYYSNKNCPLNKIPFQKDGGNEHAVYIDLF
jgi:hypothetical protein